MANALPDMSVFEGETIAGRYRLERFLDEGNFGAVYRASQLAYGLELRQVAIKIAKRPMSDSEARRAFDEALTMARVADATSDPALRQHFVSVYDAGRCPEGGALAGHPFVAMELISGGSVKKSLKLGPFPLTRAVAYFDQMLRAMAFMHQNNLIHRDLKPGNILISRRPDGSDAVKISDFGLVIAVDRLLGWASSGGDLAYLAPESFSDDRCSRQSDVYMLGLVFHEMLTGVNPFSEVGTHLRGDDESKHPELRRLHLAARHHLSLSILEQQAELKQQPALAAVIRNSLQADLQSRRYASATEMLADWENAKSQLDRPRVAEQPWDAVRRILREAEQSLKVGDRARYAALLADAMRINRDPRSVPDSMVVGTAYQRMVEWLTTNSQTDEAGEIAMEGYRRRKCRATCLAISKYYEAVKSPVAAAFRVEANGYGEES